jgi:hypothetical protein
LQFEGDQVTDARALGVFVGFGNALWVDVHSNAAGAVHLRCRDRNTPVATSEVVHDVGFGDRCELEHAVHDFLGGRHVGRQMWGVGTLSSSLAGDRRAHETNRKCQAQEQSCSAGASAHGGQNSPSRDQGPARKLASRG